jgi:hypothetical protein
MKSFEFNVTFSVFAETEEEAESILLAELTTREDPADRISAGPIKNSDYLIDVWNYEDVLSVRPDLDEEQAKEVLYRVGCSRDANYGICWDTLTDTAESMYPEPEDEE